jgi:drug/metabolite transporter (DMT)-like permease
MTQVLSRTTHLLDGRKNIRMTGRVYLRAIVPVGVLYSLSLVCSNLTYHYLSVAFIQMLKAAAPASVLLVGYAFGTDTPNLKVFLNICVIVAGVALASYGEVDFSFIGFLYQLGGLIFESVRLIMVQKLLTGSGDDYKMDPLVSLYYYAPVCAVMNVLIAIPSEAGHFDWADLAKVGPIVLIANAAVAFLLNVASVFLVCVDPPGSPRSLALTNE